MWLLGRILPIVIGDLVPEDDKWQNFLTMMRIVDLLFCSKTTADHVGYLSRLISEHHHNFVQLYTASVIPKMHFMVHMPRLILQ